MRTASARGEMVRSYFLAIEDLLANYTRQFINGIETDMRQLESSLKPPHASDYAGYIYVIRASDNVYKLGRTKKPVHRRRNYRTGHVDVADVLLKYRTDNLKAVEDCVKTALRESRTS
jgi:hypothetical protein